MISVLLALACQDVSPGTEGDKSLQTLIHLDVGAADLTLRDMDGDGDMDLVRVDGAGLAVFTLGERGRYARAPTALMKWPVGRTAWTVADMDGSGTHRVLLLTGEGRVFRHDFDGEGFSKGRLMVEDDVFLPPGITAMDFCRDVDGDGLPDLVLPTRSAHHVYLANGAGFDPPLIIAFDLSITISAGSPGQLGARVGRQVSVPKFRMYDLDGDGDLDLAMAIFGNVNQVYLNDGTATAYQGVFPFSIAGQKDNTVALALDDFDGDGNLDVAVANIGQGDRVYLNDGTGDPFNMSTPTPVSAQALNSNDIQAADLTHLLENMSNENADNVNDLGMDVS